MTGGNSCGIGALDAYLRSRQMNRHPLAAQAAEGPLPRRPLDILIVTSEAPPIVSGISTCVDRLATGLTARDHQVRVLSCAQIRRVVFGEWRLSSFAAHWPRIVRELPHFDVDNVHGPVPTVSDVFLWPSRWLPPHARPAVVYTHHAPIDIPEAAWMSMRYNRLHPGPARGPAPRITPASIAAGSARWCGPSRGEPTRGRQRRTGSRARTMS